MRSSGVVGSALANYRCVLAVLLLVGGPASLVSERQPLHTYRATKPYLVAGTSADAQAVVNGDTDRVARDYAGVLRRDDQLLDELARAVGTSRSHVSAHLQVGYVTAGSTLFIRYDDERAGVVRQLFGALDQAVTRTSGTSPGLPAGFLRPLGRTHVEQRTNLLRPFPGAAAVGALLLGLLLAVVLERSRGRVSDAGRLRLLTDRPVLPAGAPEELDAVLVRALLWQPDRIVVTAADAAGPGASEAAGLVAARRDELVRVGDLDPAAADVVIEPATSGTPEPQDSVLVAVTGKTALRSVRDVLAPCEAARGVVLAVFPAVSA